MGGRVAARLVGKHGTLDSVTGEKMTIPRPDGTDMKGKSLAKRIFMPVGGASINRRVGCPDKSRKTSNTPGVLRKGRWVLGDGFPCQKTCAWGGWW